MALIIFKYLNGLKWVVSRNQTQPEARAAAQRTKTGLKMEGGLPHYGGVMPKRI